MMDLQKRLDLEEIYRAYMEAKPNRTATEVEVLSDLGLRDRARPGAVPEQEAEPEQEPSGRFGIRQTRPFKKKRFLFF